MRKCLVFRNMVGPLDDTHVFLNIHWTDVFGQVEKRSEEHSCQCASKLLCW